MNGKSKPYAILVFGAPMSGKTTFAEQFSARFNAPFLNLSELYVEHKLSRKLSLVLIEQISKCKQTKANYRPVLIWVQTDLNAIKHRMRHKYKKLDDAKAALAEQYKKIEAPSELENPLVISGKHTFQTQCKNVLANLSDRKRNAR